MKTIYKEGSAQITEKKSRFIATIRPVTTQEQAQSFIDEIKKKYYDARHNCSACVLGERGEILRSSDDGEPQGTAGHPMLDVLTGQGLTNTAVVVTRYFGGVLLGTGGLVRAYSKATQEALASCVIIERKQGIPASVSTDYNGIGKLQYLLGQEKIQIFDSVYEEKVKIKILIPQGDEDRIIKTVIEVTNGTAEIDLSDPVTYAEINGELHIFSDTE